MLGGPKRSTSFHRPELSHEIRVDHSGVTLSIAVMTYARCRRLQFECSGLKLFNTLLVPFLRQESKGSNSDQNLLVL